MQEILSVGNRLGARFVGFVLAMASGFAATAHAECTAPAQLEAKIKAHPTTDNAVLLGSYYASHKQFDCAVATFRAALKADPKSAQLHYLAGLAYVDSNRTGDALPELQKAVDLDPEVIKPHEVLAFVLDQTGNHQEAEQQWHKALAIDPKSVTALEGLSQDLLDRNAYIDAALLLRSAPRTEKLTINLARALGNMNMLDEARETLTEALAAHPDSLPLSSALIVVLVKQVRFQDAINLAQHIADANPTNQAAIVQLFRILVLTNHINAARPIGPKLLAACPHDPEVLYLNGIVLRSVGDYAGAKTLLEQSVAADPNSPNSHYELGMVLVFLKDWAPARQQLEKAIAMGAKEPQAHYQLALALRGLGESQLAQQEMRAYQDQKASDEANLEASMKASQADDELKNDKVQDAIGHYKEAVAAKPDNANYKYKLALALHETGDVDGERAQLEQAVKLDPNLAGAQNELGYLLSRAGDSKGAIEHFRQATRSAPGYADAWINLCAELATAGQFPEARDAIAMALRLEPDNDRAKRLNDRLSQDSAARQAHP
jgi:tetratricopeptide (TPR) repeat protein